MIDLAALELVKIDGEIELVLRLGHEISDTVPSLVKRPRSYTIKEAEIDRLAAFLSDRTEVVPTERVRAGELKKAYRLWCADQGFVPVERIAFCRDMRALGFEQMHSNGSWWLGLRLRLDSGGVSLV